MLEICDIVNGMQKVNRTVYLFTLKITLIRMLNEINQV